LLDKVSEEVPPSLRHINAIESHLPDANLDRVSSLVFETFRLLRKERKVFISYKRSDSTHLADCIYDALDRRGFDVFIDTRTVPPAADFQAELWHRLSDSDVVVLIDTPGFRASRWTTEELARANATNIQILHVLWPEQAEDPTSPFSYFFTLTEDDFTTSPLLGSSVDLEKSRLNELCNTTERLRARAIAARYRYLVDSFCDMVKDFGMTANVQPERWISVGLKNGDTLAVVPAIGVPTSSRINEIFVAISAAGIHGRAWMIYDNRGLMENWTAHLDWLDEHLPVRAIRMSAAKAALTGLVP
jgi:hypothetical protein